jgi:uncharacterized protein
MKKPKKTATAKPRSQRPTRSRTKTGAKIAKKKPTAAAKKTAVKKPRKIATKKTKPASVVAAPPARKKSAAAPKAPVELKRKMRAKAPPVAEVIAEAKPPVQAVTPKRTGATAKAAPKSPLLDVKPLPLATRMAKVVAPVEPKTAASPKIVAKPKVKAPKETAPKSEPISSELPADEKPEMAVELLFERKKITAKPRAKTKRVTKPESKATTAPVVPAETEPVAETKTPAAKSLPAATPPRTRQSSQPARKAPANIPPILLEGDKPAPAPVSGPGHRYALGPKPPTETLQTEGELPESYGTGTILLTARDPHWLYTHWDFSSEQQRRYNGFSRDGHLIVRIYVDAARGKPAAQVHVHPDSRHWFVHVDRANTRYVAELGYYSAADKWKVIATSDATVTPPDAVSADTTAQFGTMPAEVPMEKLVALVKQAVQESAPLAQAVEQLRGEGHPELPRIEAAAVRPPDKQPSRPPEISETRRRDAGAPRGETRAASAPPRWTPSEWTPAQERALAEVISMDYVRRVWMGSLEITELIRRQYMNELASMAAAEQVKSAPGAPPEGAIGGISSPVAIPGAREKGFWFNVNAELIVYGATEPNATVSIGGRKIRLRPDGSFSYRFALPDGNYEMPVVAVSADETDGRAAELTFSRSTEYRGDVGTHPQDPSLQRMTAENF